MGKFKYFFAIQTLLPDDWKSNADFARNLEAAAKLGLDGMELNAREPEKLDPAALKSYLAGFGLVMSNFASGFTAKSSNLSLATEDEARRKESLRRTAAFLAFAREMGCGVIAGFLKGAMGDNKPANLERLKESIAELASTAERLKTPFIVEAINRFESPLGHSLEEVWALIKDCRGEYVQMLPDTYHMNIEEVDMLKAIDRFGPRFKSFHVSENNRFFPGLGAIRFGEVVAQLDRIGYRGKVTIEGNIRQSFIDDLSESVKYLAPILRS